MKTLILLALLLSGCGKSSGSSASSKDLFSTWTTPTSSLTLHLEGGSIGTPLAMYWMFSNGARCNSNILITGSQTSGNYTVSGASYIGGGSGDPGCASLNTTGTFTKPASVLTCCDSGGCVGYN